VILDPNARRSRAAALAALVVAYLVIVASLFRVIQLRVWNSFGAVDVLALAAMILPFLIVPWLDRARSLSRVTRFAWVLCAIMAFDLLFFAIGKFGPRGSGHPSLEALGSYFLGMAKVVLIPATLVLLGIACIKRERMIVVALGFICLVGETLYATYPNVAWAR
jgi:hypothetical protein